MRFFYWRTFKKFVLKDQEASFEEEYISGLYVPVYQRDFVWHVDMQSKFIESLFMGVPIQPLFAFELDDDGNMELFRWSSKTFIY